MVNLLGAPKLLIDKMRSEAEKEFPFPKETDRIISPPLVLQAGKYWLVGQIAIEWDIYAGWILLPEKWISDFYPDKGLAIEEFMRVRSEQQVEND